MKQNMGMEDKEGGEKLSLIDKHHSETFSDNFCLVSDMRYETSDTTWHRKESMPHVYKVHLYFRPI